MTVFAEGEIPIENPDNTNNNSEDPDNTNNNTDVPDNTNNNNNNNNYPDNTNNNNDDPDNTSNNNDDPDNTNNNTNNNGNLDLGNNNNSDNTGNTDSVNTSSTGNTGSTGNTSNTRINRSINALILGFGSGDSGNPSDPLDPLDGDGDDDDDTFSMEDILRTSLNQSGDGNTTQTTPNNLKNKTTDIIESTSICKVLENGNTEAITEGSSIATGDKIRVEYKFKDLVVVPNDPSNFSENDPYDIVSGSIITIPGVPSYALQQDEWTKEVSNKGVSFGTATLKKDGTATFTVASFTELTEAKQATFYYEFQFTLADITNSTSEDFVLKLGNTEVNVKLADNMPNAPTALTKSAAGLDSNGNITWTVTLKKLPLTQLVTQAVMFLKILLVMARPMSLVLLP